MQKSAQTSNAEAEHLAREMLEASRQIEAIASRAAEQIEAVFFAYAKELRALANASLPEGERVERGEEG